MRLFVAAALPASFGPAVERILERAKRACAGADVAWEPAEKVHLTVKFLGEVAEDRLGAIGDEARSLAGTFAPFEITLGAFGAFPDPNAPRILFVEIAEGRDRTVALMHAVDDACAAVGFAKEDRPPHPHLTLGRTRSRRASVTVANLVGEATGDAEERGRIDRLTLIESRAGRYETRAAFPFRS